MKLLKSAFFLIVFSTIAIICQAQDNNIPVSSVPDEAPAGLNVSNFLKTDGSFDLEAARASGYQGSLDMKGFKAAFDPATGQPLFQPSGTQESANHPDDIYWDNSISPTSLYRYMLYGNLNICNDQLIASYNGIYSLWDGSQWLSLGADTITSFFTTTTPSTVDTLIFICTPCYPVWCPYKIVYWDGLSWSVLDIDLSLEDDSVFQPRVTAACAYENQIIIAGHFDSVNGIEANNIAAWNGLCWSSLGDGISGLSSYVSALVTYQQTLIAGGGFDYADGITVNNIAMWNGFSWLPLSSGLNGEVLTLTTYNGNMIAGGSFETAGTDTVYNIASWNGHNWSPLASGLNAPVNALTVFDGDLIVGGYFETTGTDTVNSIAFWNGTNWSAMGTGMDDKSDYPFTNVFSFAEYKGKLIASGEFIMAGDARTHNIAAWDGSTWTSLGSAVNGPVLAFTIYNGKLIIGGGFDAVGWGLPANGIASWDGSYWAPLGSGVRIATDAGWVLALTVYNNRLVVGGEFDSAGGVAANCIAAWNDTNWTPLGSGVNVDIPPYRGIVKALAVFQNKLIAGGFFLDAGGVSVHDIASWNDTSWSSLGSGLQDIGGPRLGTVSSMAVLGDSLIVGGTFNTAGGLSITGLAAWDGDSWSDFDNWELYDNVSFLTVSKSVLYVLGDGGISSWNGLFWINYPLTHEPSCPYPNELIISTLFNNGDTLFLAGRFSGSESCAFSGGFGFFDWTSLTWYPAMGSGINIGGDVYVVTEYQNQLIFGGSFTGIGGKVASNIAAWTNLASCCIGLTGNTDCSESEDPDITDISTIIDHLYLSHKPLCCPEEADTDGSGGDPDITDITRIIDFLYLSHNPLAPCP